MKPVILAVVAASLFGSASAQELWRGAKVGDTQERIKEIFPQAKTFETPAEYSDDRWAYLYLDQLEIGGEYFDVRFVMSGDELDAIQMTMSEDATGQVPYSSTFQKVETLLSRRYGEPVFEMPAQLEDPGFLRVRKNEFREGDLTVRANCVFCDRGNGSLNIDYSYQGAADAQGF